MKVKNLTSFTMTLRNQTNFNQIIPEDDQVH